MSLQFHINTAIFPISDEFYRRRDLIAQEPCRTKLRLFVCVFDFCFLTDVPHWFFSLPFNDSELSCGQLIWRKGQNSRKNRNKSTVFLLNIFTSGLGVISQTNGSHWSEVELRWYCSIVRGGQLELGSGCKQTKLPSPLPGLDYWTAAWGLGTPGYRYHAQIAI